MATPPKPMPHAEAVGFSALIAGTVIALASGVNVVLVFLAAMAAIGLGLAAIAGARYLVMSPEQRAVQRDYKSRTFGGYTLWDDHLEAPEGAISLAGLTAHVESAGEITSRLSATRVVAFGLGGLLARKKVDNRELYLTIEGPEYAAVKQLNAASDGLRAREFAARINLAGRRP